MRFVGSYNWSVDEKLEEMEVIFKSIYEKNASSHLEEPYELGFYTFVMQHAFALLPAPVRRMLCEERLEENSFFRRNRISSYTVISFICLASGIHMIFWK